MKKNDLTKEVAKRLKVQKIVCDRVLEVMIDVIREAIERGESVKIRDFVTFEIYEYKQRKGYNPYTGKIENFNKTHTVKCKAGKNIKEAAKIYSGEVDE